MLAKRSVFAGVAALMLTVVMSPSAGGTPAQGDVQRTDLAEGTTDAPIAIVAVGQPTTLYVQNIVLGPAASSGWHTHPGPEYSVINDGTMHVRTASDCAPTAFGAGQAVSSCVEVRIITRGPTPVRAPMRIPPALWK